MVREGILQSGEQKRENGNTNRESVEENIKTRKESDKEKIPALANLSGKY